MELKKQQQKIKNQETDAYETDKRPRTEKLKRKEIALTEKLEKQESPANAKGTRDSSACMKAHCEQM